MNSDTFFGNPAEAEKIPRYTGSKNRTKKDKDYIFEGDDEFVDGDGKARLLQI